MNSRFPKFPPPHIIQPVNEPWTRTAAGRYGRQMRLTFSEAIGTTGGTQTTILDASLNGNFFGKFQNAATHMGGAQQADLLNHNYPAALCPGLPNKPHAEDYLLTALETEWIASGNWYGRYASAGGVVQQAPLLSIRLNRSP